LLAVTKKNQAFGFTAPLSADSQPLAKSAQAQLVRIIGSFALVRPRSVGGSIGVLRLFKSHADAFLFTPDDTAGQVIAIRHQSEPSGDSDWTRDLERSAGSGQISNRAINASPTEFDGPALQDAMPGRNPLFLAHCRWCPQDQPESPVFGR